MADEWVATVDRGPRIVEQWEGGPHNRPRCAPMNEPSEFQSDESPATESPVTESPCIKVCVLDGDVCTECGRLLQEIAEWSRMTAAERRDIRHRAAARLRTREQR